MTILDPDQNLGYLPKPIPIARDREISDLLSQSMRDGTIGDLQGSIKDSHAMVLRAFAERMASGAVRNHDSDQLRLGLVALLLTLRRSDSRDGWMILPLFYDAILRLGLDTSEFLKSVRQNVGDIVASSFSEFLRRSDKSLGAMGYSDGADEDGFRYVRLW